MELDSVRHFALSLPEVTEQPYFELASFRVCGKIFATAPTEGSALNRFVGEDPRELAAVTRIFGLLPEPQRDQLLALWQEFDGEEAPESRFANAADRAMPVLLNLANHGQSWRENGISHERVVRRIRPQIEAGCPVLWAYLETRLDDARGRGWFGA